MATHFGSGVLSSRRSPGPRSGFTLVELLAVVAIIAVLLGLLLPAVNGVRNSARRTQCANNMKQLVTAVRSYEAANGILPSLFGISPLAGIGQPVGTWLTHILPYIDMQPAYDQLTRNSVTVVLSTTIHQPSGMYCEVASLGNINFNAAWNSGNGDPTKTIHALVPSLPLAQCPGDPVQSQKINWMYDKDWLLTNYFGNSWVFLASMGATDTRDLRPTSTNCGLAYNSANRWDRRSWVGTFRWHTYENPLKLARIRDGLANTILLAEGMRQCNEDRRRCNAGYSTCGVGYRESFRPAFYGSMVDQNDPNYINYTHNFGWNTNIPSPGTQTGYANTLMFQSMPSLELADPWRMQAMHGPGLVVAMCDGSVRTIDYGVSRREASDPDGPYSLGSVNFGCTRSDGVWDMLMLPNDRQPLPGDAL